MEYLACEVFKKYGYVVENQIPLLHTVGSPDFGGYQTQEQIKFINDYHRLPKGFHIIELAMIRIFNFLYDKTSYKPIDTAIVGEAKTGTTSMSKQILKYLDTGLFDLAYEIHPYKDVSALEILGLISIDSENKICIQEPRKKYTNPKKSLNRADYFKWLNNYFKFYLLANLNNDELNTSFYNSHKHKIENPGEIVDWISDLSFDELLTEIIKEK